MTTSIEAEGLVVDPQALAGAANEEFLANAAVRSSTGWDPYEVWRTRIKAVQDAGRVGVALG